MLWLKNWILQWLNIDGLRGDTGCGWELVLWGAVWGLFFFLPNLMNSGLWENPINKKETIKFLKSLKQHEIINDSCCSFWIYL